MPKYLLTSGEEIEYPTPAPDVAAFLNRLNAAASDPKVNVGQFVALVYGDENPVLDRGFVPGRAVVTRAVLDNPAWLVMSDLIGVKRVQLGLLDPAKAEAAYTVSVKDAADQLGITPAAVRAAITARKLAGRLRNGQWYTRPEAVAGYQVSNRGRKKLPAIAGLPVAVHFVGSGGVGPSAAQALDKLAAQGLAAVLVQAGNEPGASLSVRLLDGDLIRESNLGRTVVGRFPPGWKRAVVRTTAKTTKGKSVRAFEIAPADGQEEIVLGGGKLFVRGFFKIVKKVNNPKQVQEVWKYLL